MKKNGKRIILLLLLMVFSLASNASYTVTVIIMSGNGTVVCNGQTVTKGAAGWINVGSNGSLSFTFNPADGYYLSGLDYTKGIGEDGSSYNELSKVKDGKYTTTISSNRTYLVEFSEGVPSTESQKAVDLGLSVDWANMNLGAVNSIGAGNLYLWNINQPSLEWGSNWRLPTHDEQVELATKCSWSTVRVNGTEVFKVTGPNGNYIYLPKTGWAPCYDGYTGETQVTASGFYWSSNTFESSNETLCYALSYDGSTLIYNNGYNISVVKMAIRPVSTSNKSCSLSIQSSGSGTVSYDGNSITNTTRTFTVYKGSSAILTFTPSSGYYLSKLTVGGTDVTSSVSNNRYTISNITANTTVVATFKAILLPFSQDGINYEVRSTADYTLNVGKGNYSGHVVIPATVTYDGDTWTVAGVVDGAFNHSGIPAIIWNPRTVLSNSAFGSDMNPNMLVYVQSESYAPTNVQNIVANGRAKKIVLTDAASGNDFNCPVAFTAEEISYTHRYGMTTGIGECRGWETIALPFDVKQFTHESKGKLIPFKVYSSTSAGKPFWLYELTATGFVEAEGIEANKPYIISMPNNSYYVDTYNLAGKVTFSAENVSVLATADIRKSTYGEKTFVPAFTAMAASINVYALNANNDYCTNTDYRAEGSTFIRESRSVHPFEAYMTTSSANAKREMCIFDDLPTAIREIPTQGEKGVRIYSMSGELIMFDQNISIEEALKHLKRGVYFVNGKKMVVTK